MTLDELRTDVNEILEHFWPNESESFGELLENRRELQIQSNLSEKTHIFQTMVRIDGFLNNHDQTAEEML